MSTTSARTINLVPLDATDADTQMKVRKIRNEEGVRKWMYTDHVIGVDEHRKWIDRLKQDDTQIVFVIVDDEGAPLGIVSVNAIDRLHKKADWAYYLTKNARGGLGSTIEYCFINFVFDCLGIEKLNCEVIEGNDAVVRLHKKFLFQEEGLRRSNILKDGARIGVNLLGLTKDEWYAGREALHEKYGGILSKYAITIQWRYSKA